MKYFLYVRKSSDKEDRQVLSIEAQLSELRTLARREDLVISKEFVEKQSAKMPGRPHFNEMVDSVRQGKADGILSPYRSSTGYRYFVSPSTSSESQNI
jgi:site-specific DNA recombinase